MMWMLATSWVDRALGLRELSVGQEGVTLGWRYALPMWVWVVIVLGVAGAGWLAYRRLLGPRPVRWALAGVRTLLLLVLAALLAGPMLVRSNEKVEEDWLLVLVDRSASMALEDMLGPGGEAVSRDAALQGQLQQQATVFDGQHLGEGRRLHWLGFAGDTFAVDDPLQLPKAAGARTSLRSAIENALQAATGRPISGIVLFTDGRSPQATGGDLVRRLQQQAVSVFPVPLGATVAPLDLAIAQIDAPERAFVKDQVPVSVWIDVQGDTAGFDPQAVTVRLRDEVTAAVLDEARLDAGHVAGRALQLTARSDAVGPTTWAVELVHDGGAAAPRELVTSNNRRSFPIELIDRPIRVLYVEGYPRWEYRYLVTMLKREASIQSSVMLLSADREFAQEGDLPITRLPQTAEEFEPYDVIVVGDVPAGYFSAEQITLMRDQVSSRGTGLLWIGGSRDTPVSYDGTPLADLLPMRRPVSVTATSLPRTASPAPLAQSLGVMQLIDADAPAGAEPTWPASLAPLQWTQDLGELKQAAEVLATARGDTDDTPPPLIARLRYGAGQAAYVATDDTWRWRYGRGELYHEQFWMQMVRMLARTRLQAATGRVRLAASARRLSVDQPLVVELVVDDPAVLARDLPRVTVSVRQEGSDDELDRVDLVIAPEAGSTDPAAPGAPGTPGVPAAEARRRTYRGTWRPREPGTFTLSVRDPAWDDRPVTASVEVLAPDDELRQTLPDHERLAALATATGGQVVPLDQLTMLESLVPNRARKTPDDQREPLWNSYLALALVVLLLTVEWVIRKAIRLA